MFFVLLSTLCSEKLHYYASVIFSSHNDVRKNISYVRNFAPHISYVLQFSSVQLDTSLNARFSKVLGLLKEMGTC